MRETRFSLDHHLRFLILAIALIAFKQLVVDRIYTLFRHPELQADGTLPRVEQTLDRSYADGLNLIGYDQSSRKLPADDALRVDLYWTVRKQPSRRYQSVIHLVGPDGFRWSRDDTFRPRDYQDSPPTTTWSPDRYALDSHGIEPLPGTPPGRYAVVLSVFDRETLAPLSVLNEQGQPTAPELTLGTVTVSHPRSPSDPRRLRVRERVDVRLGPLTLLGAEFDRRDAVPGDPVLGTLFWRAAERPSEDLTLRMALQPRKGPPLVDYTRSPAASWHPTSAWQLGEVWRGQHVFYLPADLDTGTYTWTLSLPPSSSRSVPLSRLSVTAPERVFTRPSMDVETTVGLGDIATLLGANVSPQTSGLEPGTALRVTLFWRAEAQTDTSYRVFLHLIDPQGGLVAQSDGVPVEWSRPTTGWVPGEILSDVRTIDIPADVPAGDYALRAGLYAAEGGRLSTPQGAEAVSVTTVTVDG